MTASATVVDSVAGLRKALNDAPRARLQFAKAIVNLLEEHDIAISGDLLGRLTLASCDEMQGSGEEVMGVWTN